MLCHVNVGGCLNKLPWIDQFWKEAGTHVMLFSETWLLVYGEFMRTVLAAGGKWIGLPARPPGGQLGGPGRPSGGVGFLVLDPTMKVHLEHSSSKGLLSVALQRPGFAPFAVVGVYCPPPNSGRNVAGRSFSASLFAEVVAEYKRLVSTGRYDTVLIAGDFNQRVGDMGGIRRSRDVKMKRADYSEGVALLKEMGVTPVHGRIGQPIGHYTSRSPEAQKAAESGSPGPRGPGIWPGYAEVDFIATTPELGVDRINAVPDMTWPAELSHRPIAVRIALTPLRRAPPPPTRDPPRIRTGEYGDVRWHQVADALEAGFTHLPLTWEPERVEVIYSVVCALILGAASGAFDPGHRPVSPASGASTAPLGA